MLPACDYGDDGHLVSVAVVSRVDRVSLYSFFDCAPGWVEDSGRLSGYGKIQVAHTIGLLIVVSSYTTLLHSCKLYHYTAFMHFALLYIIPAFYISVCD